MASIKDYNSFDKAAIVFQILGDALAVALFDGISESQFKQLKVRSRELLGVPVLIKKEILEEYYGNLLTSKKYSGKQDESDKPFEFLLNLNEEQLYALLADEDTRIKALALEQLSDDAKYNIINKFPLKQKNDVMREFGNLNDIPLEAVVNIALSLENKAATLPGPKEFSRGGGKSVAEMLNRVSEDEAKRFLDQLKVDDQVLFNDVRKYFISFDDIIKMPNALAEEFYMSPDLDLDTLSNALFGYEEEIINKTVEYLPPKKQAMFTPPEGKVNQADVSTARSVIVKMVKTKVENGEWAIEDILSVDEEETSEE